MTLAVFASTTQILSSGAEQEPTDALNYDEAEVFYTDTESSDDTIKTLTPEQAVEGIKYYYKSKGTLDSFWEMAAVSRFFNINEFALPGFNSNDTFNSATDYAGRIIGHVIKGENPRTIYESRDIVSELVLLQDKATGKFGDFSNQHIWSMLALDIVSADYDRDKALSVLLSFQNSDGSFGEWAEYGDDELGMAFLALSGYLDNADVSACVNKSVLYLKDRYRAELPDNSNTLATVMSGLTAIGEDVGGSSWSFNGTSLINQLLKYSCDDGGFGYMLSSDASDAFSTYSAAIALGDSLDGQSIFIKLKSSAPNAIAPTEPTSEPNGASPAPTAPPSSGGSGGSSQTVTAYLTVKGYDGNVLYNRSALSLTTSDTPFTALSNALGSDVLYSGSGASVYVYGIKGLKEYDYGADSGWLYLVNGLELSMSANSYKLKDGDNIVWQYSHTYTSQDGNGAGDSYLLLSAGGKASQAISLDALIDNISKAILKKSALTDWELMALTDAGIKPGNKHIEAFKRNIKGEYRLITDLERTILLCQRLDIDPNSYGLIDMLIEKDFEAQGSNGLIYGILALDAEGMDTDELILRLLKYQKPSGGFSLSLSPDGSAENADITAMALFALSKHTAKPDVKNAADTAVSWLSEKQDKDGGYISYGKQSSETAAQVITALSVNGADPAGSRFTKGGRNLLTNLESFMLDDYTFEHEQGGGSDPVATEQALRALCAYRGFLNTADMPQAESTAAPEYKEEQIFADESDISDWALPYVKKAYENKYMIGDDAKKFLPKKSLTASELVTVLAKMQGIKTESYGNSDTNINIDSKRWDYIYIKTAYTSGWFRGLDLNSLIDRPLNRGETALIISNALNLSGKSPTIQEGINNVMKKGIMVGDGEDFRSNDSLSREMLAVICEKIGN